MTLALALLADAPALWPASFVFTDHLILWYVGRLVAIGASPYETGAWVDAATRYGSPHIQEILDHGAAVWPYPPWTGLLFAPFGIFPVEIGPWLLHAAFILVGLAAAIGLARMLPWRTQAAVAVAIVVFAAFQPFVIAARWGQFTSFLFAGSVLVLAGLHRRQLPLLIAGALLVSAKPQLTVILGLAVAFELIRRRAVRDVAALAAAFAVMVGVTWARYPEWLEAATSGGGVRIGLIDIFASTWSFALNLSPQGWPVIVAILIAAVLACAAAAVHLSTGDVRLAVLAAGGLLAGVAIVPIAYAYDHVVLAPILMLAVLALDRSHGLPRALQGVFIVAVGLVVPWVAFFVSVAGPTQAIGAIVPILFAPLLVSSAMLLRSDTPIR